MNIREHFKQNKLPFIMSPILVIVFFYVRQLFMDNIDKEQYYQHSFSDYGTFMAGTVGVVLTALNLYYLLHIWKQQKAEFEKQSNEQKARFEQDRSERKEMFDQEQKEQKARFEQERIEQKAMFETELAEQKERFKKEQDAQNLKFEQQRIEERFFNLLEMRKEMRDEITCQIEVVAYHKTTVYGNRAIDAIAEKFVEVFNKNTGVRRTEELADLYRDYGKFLRHYFDLILHIIEYIDKQQSLDHVQKIEYMSILKASSSNNEASIWYMMMYDYENNSENANDIESKKWMELVRQDERFDRLNKIYNLLDGKVLLRTKPLPKPNL